MQLHVSVAFLERLLGDLGDRRRLAQLQPRDRRAEGDQIGVDVPPSGAAIGLHIGGESFVSIDEYAIACHMDSALDGLNLRLANFDDLDAAVGVGGAPVEMA